MTRSSWCWPQVLLRQLHLHAGNNDHEHHDIGIIAKSSSSQYDADYQQDA